MKIAIEFEFWNDGKCYQANAVLKRIQPFKGDTEFLVDTMMVTWGNLPVTARDLILKARYRAMDYVAAHYDELCACIDQEKQQSEERV